MYIKNLRIKKAKVLIINIGYLMVYQVASDGLSGIGNFFKKLAQKSYFPMHGYCK
jgi:hypothetical protein